MDHAAKYSVAIAFFEVFVFVLDFDDSSYLHIKNLGIIISTAFQPSVMHHSLCASSLLLALRLLQLEGSLEDEQAIARGQFSEDSMRLLWQPEKRCLSPECWSGLSPEALGPVSKYIMVGRTISVPSSILRITIELSSAERVISHVAEVWQAFC